MANEVTEKSLDLQVAKEMGNKDIVSMKDASEAITIEDSVSIEDNVTMKHSVGIEDSSSVEEVTKEISCEDDVSILGRKRKHLDEVV